MDLFGRWNWKGWWWGLIGPWCCTMGVDMVMYQGNNYLLVHSLYCFWSGIGVLISCKGREEQGNGETNKSAVGKGSRCSVFWVLQVNGCGWMTSWRWNGALYKSWWTGSRFHACDAYQVEGKTRVYWNPTVVLAQAILVPLTASATCKWRPLLAHLRFPLPIPANSLYYYSDSTCIMQYSAVLLLCRLHSNV